MKRTSSSLVGVVVATVVAALPAAAQQWGYGPTMMGDHGWWGMFLGPFMMIAVIAAIVAFVALLVRWFGAPGHGHPSPFPGRRTALDILKERFAKGEIDKDEYEQRRRILEE